MREKRKRVKLSVCSVLFGNANEHDASRATYAYYRSCRLFFGTEKTIWKPDP